MGILSDMFQVKIQSKYESFRPCLKKIPKKKFLWKENGVAADRDCGSFIRNSELCDRCDTDLYFRVHTSVIMSLNN